MASGLSLIVPTTREPFSIVDVAIDMGSLEEPGVPGIAGGTVHVLEPSLTVNELNDWFHRSTLWMEVMLEVEVNNEDFQSGPK